MRGKTHKPARATRGMTGMALAIAASLIVAGCSAANLTGFDFPVFGLMKKSDKENQETPEPANAPASPQRLGTQ